MMAQFDKRAERVQSGAGGQGREGGEKVNEERAANGRRCKRGRGGNGEAVAGS